jgi:peptidoglycan hydrolase CwlO-like protein
MITAQHQQLLVETIRSLSEIELDDLFKEVADHCRKNNLAHLLENHFDVEDLQSQVDELEEKVDKLEDENSDLEKDKDDLETKISDTVDILGDLLTAEFGEDFGKEEIEKAIKKLQS